MIYTVTAYRWGDREKHSYIVGVYNQKDAALKAAEFEEDYRGGKYGCEVLEWDLNESLPEHRMRPKLIESILGVHYHETE